MEDLVSHPPVKFILASFSSYHKCFYSKYGPSECDLEPSILTDLSFTIDSNPIDSTTFFMLMVEPVPKKTPYTFLTLYFHYQHFPDEEHMEAGEAEEVGSPSWKAHMAMFTHPCEEEELDYIFTWRFDHEKSVMSPEVIQRLRSKHVFQDALIS